ncbi:MAG: hypothetical protein KDA62_22580 [Planctomycetales bacterium]|nr:hypothetical protein [Planctomycetales bacterium]
MPIYTIDSHITTADEIAAHWTEVNNGRGTAALPELTLQGGYSLGDFLTDRDNLQSKVSGFQSLENSRSFATLTRDDGKAAIRERLDQFRAAVRIHAKGSPYDRSAPTLPNIGANESKFLRPFDDMANLWQRLNADSSQPGFVPPLRLRGGYELAQFESDLASLRDTFRDVSEAENEIALARGERDEMLGDLRERMRQYRSAIKLEYGKSHFYYSSLPALWLARGKRKPSQPSADNERSTEEAQPAAE